MDQSTLAFGKKESQNNSSAFYNQTQLLAQNSNNTKNNLIFKIKENEETMEPYQMNFKSEMAKIAVPVKF